MGSARDRILSSELTRRGLLSDEEIARVVARRPAELARALAEQGLVEPAALARLMAELGRLEYECPPCARVLRFSELATLPEPVCDCGRALQVRAEGARAPLRLGEYRLLRELGRGAMGVVYLAEREGLGRQFAVKVIPQGVDRDTLERFRREAEVASRITSGGVVPVFDIGVDSGRMFYAMEYVPGETLKDRLRAGPLRPREAAQLVASLAETVATAHAAGVVHRDLKPSNVILDASGQARLADFGLAQDLSTNQHLTQTGWVLGTPVYMAPEQAQDSKRSGPAADVYALGAILYRCLTGEPPHAADSMVELLQRKARQDPPPARTHDPTIPIPLERICQQALARLPAARPDAAALASSLHTWLTPTRRPARRAAGVAVLALALVGAAGAGYLATAWRGPAEPVEAPAPAQVTPISSSAPSAERLALVELAGRVADLRSRNASPDRVLEVLVSGRGALASRAEADRLEVLIVEHFLRLGRMEAVRERARGLALTDPESRRTLRLLLALSWRAIDRVRAQAAFAAIVSEGEADDPGLVSASFLAEFTRRSWPVERLRRRARQSEAEGPLQRVVGLVVRVRWLHHLIRSLDLDDAEAWLQELELEAPDHALVLWGRVQLAHARRAPQRALATLERLVQRAAPELDGPTLEQLAQVRFNTGDAAGALEAMRRLDRVPGYGARLGVRMNLGMMFDKSGHPEEAKRIYLAAARADPAAFREFLTPMGPRAALMMARLIPSLAFKPIQETPALLAAARALTTQVPAAARPKLTRAVRFAMRAARWSMILQAVDPPGASGPQVDLLLARLALGRDELERAERDLTRAAGQGALAAALELLRADLLRRRGRIGPAVAAYRRIAARGGEAGHLAGAIACLLREDVPGAQARLRRVGPASAVERDSITAELRLLEADRALQRRSGAERGEALLLDGLFAADRALAGGAALDGRLLAVRSRLLARLSFGWGIPTRFMGVGRKELEQVLAFLPGAEHRIEAALQFARSPLPAGPPQRWAREHVRRVLRADPQNGAALWVRGMLAVGLSEGPEVALDAWRRARAIDPGGGLDRSWIERYERLYPDRAAEVRAIFDGG